MDENAVKKFSVNARIKLRRSVDASMARLGIGPGHEPESIDSSGTTTVLNLPGGLRTMLDVNEAGWRDNLIGQVAREGYDNVVERIAYTRFNRIIAIRYMEVNDFLPTHVRVLSSVDEGKIEPDIVSQCIRVADALNLSPTQKEEIIALKQENQLDRLFSRMFIHECNALSRILPGLFTGTESYERLLLDLSYTVKDGVIRELVDTIPEQDFRDAVQIIGWMYQYYNTELKDQIFNQKRNVKISKEQIPAATQLFTPDWIVRYMVENSLGRVWLDGHPDDSLQSRWKYYLEEAEQEPQVKEKLKELRAPRKRMEPTDIKVIDPCMGSGHILVYAFDVLMQIYESYGYSKRDAASLIIENNLFGLDIDERAYQLAYFAVMMKARSYDSNIFSKGPMPNLHAMIETSGMDDSRLGAFGNGMDPMERSLAFSDMKHLFNLFKDARTYGSLIKVRELDFDRISVFLKARPIDFHIEDYVLGEIVAIARILSQKYDAVVTNPPYMGTSGMNPVLKKFVEAEYPSSKSDLFACFINRGLELVNADGYNSMVTMQSWMFLSSFEQFRCEILSDHLISSLMHMDNMVMGIAFGTAVSVIQKCPLPDYMGTYHHISLSHFSEGSPTQFPIHDERFSVIKQSRFDAIPGAPIAYWANEQFVKNFKKGISINTISECTGSQNKTADNDKYLRFWWEVDYGNIGPGKKWVLYAKGGKSRKWYGNLIHVVDWSDGARLFYKENKTSNLLDRNYWYKEGITYTMLSSKGPSFRYLPKGCVFDMGGPSIVSLGERMQYVLGFLNSPVANLYLSTLNPTINLQIKDIINTPLIIDNDHLTVVTGSVNELIQISSADWNDHEISYDFSSIPFLKKGLIEKSLAEYNVLIERRNQMTEVVQSDINTIFNDMYGLDVNVKTSVDLHGVDIVRDIRRLVSFFVGCLFGRYSLDTQGILIANSVSSSSRNGTFDPDADNIIPINDSTYFGDDIVIRFVEFIEVAFGKEDLEDNLKYIADNLGIKYTGTARDGIRKYFLYNFYDDHLKVYQKCPIYWLFDSGRENGFKALIYMHRYTPDLISKMRQDYLLPMLSRYRARLESAEGTERIELQKKIEEIQVYDIAMEKYASEKVSIDLDDGVKVNYAKFQNIENPGSKKRIDLLHPLK